LLCGRCGAANPDGDDVRFCRACGERLKASPERVASAIAAAGDSVTRVVVAAPELAPTTNGGVAVALAPPAVETPPLATATVPVRTLALPVQLDPLPPVKVLMLVSPYGGFWARFGAHAIDSLILSSISAPLSLAIGFAIGLAGALNGDSTGDSPTLAGLLGGVAGLVVSLAYYVALPPLAGATLGKLALGYQIVGPDCRRLSFGRSIGRYFACIPSGFAFGLGYVWIGVDSRKRGWHDRIAGTYVVRKELVHGPAREAAPRAFHS
jgi:uncharacterized RDD family membrane protein YckC